MAKWGQNPLVPHQAAILANLFLKLKCDRLHLADNFTRMAEAQVAITATGNSLDSDLNNNKAGCRVVDHQCL